MCWLTPLKKEIALPTGEMQVVQEKLLKSRCEFSLKGVFYPDLSITPFCIEGDKIPSLLKSKLQPVIL